MEILTKVLPNNHNIVMAGDFHEGSIFQHEEGIQQMIDYVLSTPNTYVQLGGDMTESICVNDKRFDIRAVANRADVPILQFLSITKKLTPIRKWILFCLMGNHDWTLARLIGNGVKDIFCRQLKVPYGSYSCKMIINDSKGKLMYKTYYTHGRKNIASTADDPIRREANMKLQLKRHLQGKFGDTILMGKGHCHKLLVAKPAQELYMVDEGERILQKYTYDIQNAPYIDADLRYYVATGSFLKQYHEPIITHDEDGNEEREPISGYGEIAEYDPVELGFIVGKVRDKKLVSVEKVVL